MNKNEFNHIVSNMDIINDNIKNICTYLENFNSTLEDINLDKIDSQLLEIKKILDINNISNQKNKTPISFINSINSNIDYLKTISNKDKF